MWRKIMNLSLLILLSLLAMAASILLCTACMHQAVEYDTSTPPHSPEAHEQGISLHTRALSRLAQADYDNAVADTDKARKLIDPQLIHLYTDDMRQVYFQSAIAYYDTGLYDDAIILFDKAINVVLSPSDYPDAYYWRGMSHYRKGSHRRAIADFDMLVGKEGDFPDAAHYRELSRERLAEWSR